MECIQSIEDNFFSITLEMDTPSRSIGLTIDQVVRVNDTLYVLSTLHRPEVGDCAIGRVKAHTVYAIPGGATDLKVKHFVLGHDWNWGKSNDITYLHSAEDFKQILSRNQCNFDISSMTQRAQEYSTGDEKLFTYIVGILYDPHFQQDPQAYLSAWKEKRGLTEEWRIPEDGARMFFDRYFSASMNGTHYLKEPNAHYG